MTPGTLRRREGRTQHRGCTFRWFVAGAGPPLVLIHGVGIGAEGWAPQLPALAPHYTCLCLDNRGFGGSQPAGERLTLELLAEDVLALMDAHGWQSAHIAGHSLGGLVALYIARRAPHRVRSLALMCTFASGAVPTALSPWMLATGLRTRIGTRAMRRRAFLKLVLSPRELAAADTQALAAQLAPIFGHDLAVQPPVAMKQLSAMRGADATSFLPALGAIPTLVISAGHDRIAPPSAGRALAAGIPGSRYVEFADSAHGVTIVQADAVNRLLLEHLAEATQRAAAAR